MYGFFKTWGVVSVAVFAVSAVAPAADILWNVEGRDGKPLFRLTIKDPALIDDTDEEPDEYFMLNEKEQGALIEGMGYWASLLAPRAKNGDALNITVFGIDLFDDNASAGSCSLENGYTQLSSALVGNPPESCDECAGGLAVITIDHSQYFGGVWYTEPMSSLPRNGEYSDLPSTLVHEMMHALGMASTSSEQNGGINSFKTNMSSWDQGLRDTYGNKAKPGMIIAMKGSPEDDGNAFVMEREYWNSGAWFTGKYVDEVLQGAMIAWADDSERSRVPGLPVNGWEPDGLDIIAELSHIELQNSLMSHQTYRNWNIPMEAELAALQDMGLDFDRRNFFGASLYNDEVIFVNTNPYYARNAEGTDWVEGRYNTNSYGIGFHVYGSNNTIRQAADLLSGGEWGMGIRMDGSQNTLSIDSGVRVHANGDGGNALLVSYGRNHYVINQGDLQALGEGGVAARFDFGSNEMGDFCEKRGSFIRVARGEDGSNGEVIWNFLELTDALSGALVDSFDVTGSLRGEKAALFISDNAYVENINIMAGAFLGGDIISEWNPANELIQAAGEDDFTTALTFGLKADAEGRATEAGDSSFFLRFEGNISGANNMNMAVIAGQLVYNGEADLLSVLVEEGATLSGMGAFSVAEMMESRGVISPGDGIGTMIVHGDFVQAESGTLWVEMDDAGNYDRLEVNGSAHVEGTLLVDIKRGYYRDSYTITPLAASGELFADYEVNCLSLSPTLTITAREDVQSGSNDIIVSTSRGAGAYSRYALTDSAQRVGIALDGISAEAPSEMQDLFAALDFSSADGGDISYALPRLSADAYGATALATLEMQRMLNDLVLSDTYRFSESRDGYDFFAQPYMGGNDQPGSIGYKSYNIGLLGGVRNTSNEGLTYGAHAAFNYMSMTGDTNGKLDSNSFLLGGHVEYAPGTEGLRLNLLCRAGVDQMQMKRRVGFYGFDASNSADWTGFSFATCVQGSYDWDLGSVLVGPLAGLDYGLATRPSVTEDGTLATRLQLDSGTYQSLRTRMGGQIAMKPLSLVGQASWLAQASVTWNHELLNDTGTTNASFAAAQDYGFSNRVKFPGRDSIGFDLGFVIDTGYAISFLVNGGSELFMHGDSSLYGNASVVWKF